LMDRSHRLERKLEVMVGVTDERQIDGIWPELRAIRRADDADYIREPCFRARLFNVSNKLRGDVDGVDFSLGPDFLCEKASEEACAGADIGHSHPGTEPARGDDLLPPGEDLPAFDFEFANILLDVRIFELLVNAWANALFLGRSKANNSDKEESSHRFDEPKRR